MKPKYIRVVSDLHLEQYYGQRPSFLAETFVPHDDRDSESVLALAGDISSKIDQISDFIHHIEKRFARVYYVPGNHEFYGHDMQEWSKKVHTALESTKVTEFSTLGVSYEELENVRFIFCTLWADGGDSLYERSQVGRALRDFYVIRKHGQVRWTVPDMAELHVKQRIEIERYLEQPFEGKTVVITHHMPSTRLCHPRFGNEINGGFASNLDLILAKTETSPDIWIHGHTHDTIDTMLWDTRIVCNPSGYFTEKNSPHNTYGPKFIEL